MDKKHHILIVDDDDRIRELLYKYLSGHNYIVSSASDAFMALEILEWFDVDLIVLDVMMPKMSGIELTRQLRPNNTIPILMLTAKNESFDRIEGLEIGADDYLAKPFEPKELLLRIESILRRIPESIPKVAVPRIGPWEFYEQRQELIKIGNDEIISLSDIECDLLSLLVESRGQPVGRDILMNCTTSSGDDVNNSRSVDVQITRLRKKVEDQNSTIPRYIKTVRGKGYMLVLEHIN